MTQTYPKLSLTPRQLCDLELLMNKGFKPLNSFLNQEDYESVLENRRLSDGGLWPIPIVLDVSESFLKNLKDENKICLLDDYGFPVAFLTILSHYQPDKNKEALLVYGTESENHPGVDYLLHHTQKIYISGILEKIQEPHHFDFKKLIHNPQTLKNEFQQRGWHKILGFQTRNPLHKAHHALTLKAAQDLQAALLLHPVIGPTAPGDIDVYTRVKCYQAVMKYYDPKTTLLSLLPLAMRMAGPREALWHALIRQNYGCTHFIIGRDHAGPENHIQQFYQPYQAQALALSYQQELNIKLVPSQEVVYLPEKKHYVTIDQVHPSEKTLKISGRELRQYLQQKKPIPEWFSFPEVIQELKHRFPPPEKQGWTIFFTGLPCAGKTTLARALLSRLSAETHCSISLLDGDEMRNLLSSELGFSKIDRDLNIQRIGYVAYEITQHKGIALCAAIAPYRKTREMLRDKISKLGRFIEIYVATPLNLCEKRDCKGLYSKARAGELQHFTGISDPYEPPLSPEIILDTSQEDIETCLKKIMDYLQGQGLFL